MIDFKGCPFCGSDNLDIWDGMGTQAGVCCNDCGVGYVEIQVSDYFTYEERYGGNFEFSMETLRYSDKGVERGMQALKDTWNTRATDKRIASLTEALQYLISVKDHKDREGKTDWYEYHKELAWKQAKTVLKG